MRYLSLILLLACSDKSASTDSGDTGDANTSPDESVEGFGDLQLAFAMDADYLELLRDTYGEKAIGTFYGSVYRTEDVTSIGPVDGAEPLASADVETVDLTPSGDETAVLHTIEGLPSGSVTILGFLDTDGNAKSDDPGPDDHDPVTLPSENAFEVVADTESLAVVYFGFLNP